MNALLLAAGYATRLYPLTENFPKALLEIGEKTVLDRLIDQIQDTRECQTICLVTNDRFYPHFDQWLHQRQRYGGDSNIVIVSDGTSLNELRLGAIGDLDFVLNHRDFVNFGSDDLLICGCDNLLGLDFRELFGFFYRDRQPVVAVHQEADSSRLNKVGVVVLGDNGFVKEMEEKPAQPKSDIVTCPIYIYPPDALALIPHYLGESYNCDAPGHFLSWLVRNRPVRAFIFHQPVYALDSFDMYHWLRDNAERLFLTD